MLKSHNLVSFNDRIPPYLFISQHSALKLTELKFFDLKGILKNLCRDMYLIIKVHCLWIFLKTNNR